MKRLLMICAVSVFLVGCAFTGKDRAQQRDERRCQKIFSLYSPAFQEKEPIPSDTPWQEPVYSQADRTQMENTLINKGYCVLRSSENVPQYLDDDTAFRKFWENVQSGKKASCEILQILPSGSLYYLRFDASSDQKMAVLITCDTTGITSYQQHAVLDWTLTENGNFYYRIYWIDDQHYSAYNRIRLNRPNEEAWQLCQDYIESVGYTGENLFLLDWSQDNYVDISINDLYDRFFYQTNGRAPEFDNLPTNPDGSVWIPASTFEAVVSPHFSIDLETLRTLARYDPGKNAYPFYPMDSEITARYSHAATDPVVTKFQYDQDGNLVLTVRVDSPDLKTDGIFTHEVTLRPLPDGSAQYLANRMLSRTEGAMPISLPRKAVYNRLF